MKSIRKKKRDVRHLYSNRIFKANYQEWKRNDSFDYLTETRKAISHYYSISENRASGKGLLLDRLTTIEFAINHAFSFDMSLLAGAASGITVGIMLELVSLLTNISTGILFIDVVAIIILTILAVFCSAMVVREAYLSSKRQHNNYYTLYILPYEKLIIIMALRKEYNFLVKEDEMKDYLGKLDLDSQKKS